jgi:hypothetical protein
VPQPFTSADCTQFTVWLQASATEFRLLAGPRGQTTAVPSVMCQQPVSGGLIMRAFRNLSLGGLLLALSLLSVSIETAKAGGGDPTWRRFQSSRAYLNNGSYSNGYYAAPATVPPSPAAVTAGGTYQSYSVEPGRAAAPVLQLYYYVDAGYYHYYYAPPRAAAPPAPGARLPLPAAPKTTAK